MRFIFWLLLFSSPLFAQTGTEDDPILLDLDSLINAGYAITVSPMDTVVYESSSVDTIKVTAKAVTVSEVVKLIGEKMRQNSLAAGGMTYTTTEQYILYDKDKIDIYTNLIRVHSTVDGEQDRVNIRNQSKHYKNKELIKETTNNNVEELWPDSGTTISYTVEMPFSLSDGGKYKYKILERILIGNNLIYKLSFESKGIFKPTIKGVVWIDYSDFVIRKMEASMTGVMPFPVIKSIPHYSMSNKKIGDIWVPHEMNFEVELHGKLPLIPDRVKMKTINSDFVFESDGIK